MTKHVWSSITIVVIMTLAIIYQTDANAGYKRGFGKLWKGHTIGSTFDLDLSKSYLSAYVDTAERIPVATNLSERTTFNQEFKFYLRQFKNTLYPKYFLLEFDLYPLTALGSYTYRKQYSFYEKLEVSRKRPHINILELAAGRYETPYGISFFFGEILSLKDPNSNINKQAGSAVMGHVITVGNRSLIKLKQEDNRWIEYDYKIKGSNSTEYSFTQWKFQLGYVYNDNPLFFKAVVFQLGRDRSSKIDTSFWSNAKFEYSFNIPAEPVYDNSVIKHLTSFQKIVVGRNFYIKNIILKFDVGVKWELFKRGKSSTFNETTFILAPNITW